MKVTRGMQRNAAKLARRSAIVGPDTLIAGLDLAKRKSVVVFMRASDRVPLGRMIVPSNGVGVAEIDRQSRPLMERFKLQRLVIGMEATGHYWKILARAANEVGLRYVIVQSFVLSRSREFDDLTRDKNDTRDARLIASLVAELRFTDVQLPTGAWAELKLLAEARADRRVEHAAAVHEQRALLELVWPELLEEMPDLGGLHLQSCLRLGLTPLQIGSTRGKEFARRLQRVHTGRFMSYMAGRIQRAARANRACDETAAAVLRLQQAAERAAAAEAAMARLEERMLQALEGTGLGWMRGQIRGLGDSLLVNLLALAGDPRRLDDAGCMLKLAGSNPTERSSGEIKAAGPIHRRGRPNLRLVSYQAAVCLARHNPEFRARFDHLTTRSRNPLEPKPARVAVANKLLRVLWAMAVSGRAYSAQLANTGRVEAAA